MAMLHMVHRLQRKRVKARQFQLAKTRGIEGIACRGVQQDMRKLKSKC